MTPTAEETGIEPVHLEITAASTGRDLYQALLRIHRGSTRPVFIVLSDALAELKGRGR